MSTPFPLNHRQLSALIVGILLHVFLSFAMAWLELYYGDTGFGLRVQFDSLVGYTFPPLISICVGLVVGTLAKKRAALLTLFSLLPMSLATLFVGSSQDFKQLSFFSLFTGVDVLLGMGAAVLISRKTVKQLNLSS